MPFVTLRNFSVFTFCPNPNHSIFLRNILDLNVFFTRVIIYIASRFIWPCPIFIYLYLFSPSFPKYRLVHATSTIFSWGPIYPTLRFIGDKEIPPQRHKLRSRRGECFDLVTIAPRASPSHRGWPETAVVDRSIRSRRWTTIIENGRKLSFRRVVVHVVAVRGFSTLSMLRCLFYFFVLFPLYITIGIKCRTWEIGVEESRQISDAAAGAAPAGTVMDHRGEAAPILSEQIFYNWLTIVLFRVRTRTFS